MTEDELLEQLKRWGAFQLLARMRRQEVAPNPRQHIIERTRRFAPLTIKRAKKKLLGRDGEARRRLVAACAGVKGMQIVPKWSNDPIRCKETRSGGPRGAGSTDVPVEMPSELQWISPAIRYLAEVAPILSLVIRFEYLHEAVLQKDRAEACAKAYGGAMSLSQYRRELDKAHGWLNGYQQARAA